MYPGIPSWLVSEPRYRPRSVASKFTVSSSLFLIGFQNTWIPRRRVIGPQGAENEGFKIQY